MDRRQLSDMLDNLGIKQTECSVLTSMDEAVTVANEVGFTVLVQLSFFLSGAAMRVAANEIQLRNFLDLAADVAGPFNIQFMAKGNDVQVIECNLRASRTFPFVSETLNHNFISSATKAMTGMDATPYRISLLDIDYVCVKVIRSTFCWWSCHSTIPISSLLHLCSIQLHSHFRSHTDAIDLLLFCITKYYSSQQAAS